MADGEIKIKTEIDNKDLDKGLKTAKKSVDSFAKDGQKSMGGFSLSSLKAVASVTALATGIKVACDTVKDLTEAYKVQEKAEVQLETASKNNPFLNSSNVQNLKNYASELQSISTVGDEELLPFMAQLASQGRTESEIMNIMSASLDVASSGAMSLESAVRNLGKTFGGYAGELGETVPAIKNLTQEQLKNGDAVKIIADQYKGMAEETAKATGTSEQLANAVGDLKEEMGSSWEKALAPIRTFFTEMITGWANAKKARREYNEAVEANKDTETTTLATLQAQLKIDQESLKNRKEALERLEAYEKGELKLPAEAEAGMKLALEKKEVLQENFMTLQREVNTLETKIAIEEQALALEKELNIERAEADKLLADQEARNKTASDHIDAITKAREKAIEQLELQAKLTGEEVDKNKLLEIHQSSYVSLITESNGLVSENNQASISLLETIKQLAPEVEAYNAELESSEEATERAEKALENLKTAVSDALTPEEGTIVDQMDAQLEALDAFYKEAVELEALSDKEKLELHEQYNQARLALTEKRNEAEKELEEQARQDAMAKTENMVSIINDFVNQFSSITTAMSDFVNQRVTADANYQKAIADKQYADGEISAEEHAKKIEEIDKKLAQEQYKIALWQWSANILSAIANTALGVTQAIGQGGVLGVVTGSLVATAGGIQLASIIANKPIPPSFATGGIVGGTSYTGDRVQAMVNSGEMILNAGQQRNLFDSINAGKMGTAPVSVTVNNTVSNKVKATPQITEAGIKILITETISEQMTKGNLSTPFATANALQSGINYPS